MSSLDERERAFERRFAQEKEEAFKMVARRNRLLGLWAASQMGLTGRAASGYAMEVVDAEITKHGDEALIRKLADDLRAAGAPQRDETIRRHLRMFAETARQELSQAGEET